MGILKLRNVSRLNIVNYYEKNYKIILVISSQNLLLRNYYIFRTQRFLKIIIATQTVLKRNSQHCPSFSKIKHIFKSLAYNAFFLNPKYNKSFKRSIICSLLSVKSNIQSFLIFELIY